MSAGRGADDSALAGLIRGRDPDALAGMYDRCEGYIAAYCSLLCGPERADEAMVAALTEFVARVAPDTLDDDLDLLLVKAVRGCASARLQAPPAAPECQLVPELLAAATNGELRHGSEALTRHLESCEECRATADRLVQAEKLFDGSPRASAPVQVRELWLALVTGGGGG